MFSTNRARRISDAKPDGKLKREVDKCSKNYECTVKGKARSK
jgi:hypothetical protein